MMDYPYEASDEASESELLDSSLSRWRGGWNPAETKENFDPIPLDLYTASSIGQYDCVCAIIASGEADLNKKNKGGWTALMYACYIGHDNIVNLLLDAGVDVNIKSTKGRTSLMLAASCGNESVVYFLLQADADIEAVDNRGWTALFHATNAGHQNMVKFLLDNGANVNHREPLVGNSALMMAAAEGHEIIVQNLLQYVQNGVEIEAKNYNGDTARSLALLNGYMKIVSLIDNQSLPITTLRSEPGLHVDEDLSSSEEYYHRPPRPPARSQRSRSKPGNSTSPSLRDGPEALARLMHESRSKAITDNKLAFSNPMVPSGYVTFQSDGSSVTQDAICNRDVTSPISPSEHDLDSSTGKDNWLERYGGGDEHDENTPFCVSGAVTIKSNSSSCSSTGGLAAALGLQQLSVDSSEDLDIAATHQETIDAATQPATQSATDAATHPATVAVTQPVPGAATQTATGAATQQATGAAIQPATGTSNAAATGTTIAAVTEVEKPAEDSNAAIVTTVREQHKHDAIRSQDTARVQNDPPKSEPAKIPTATDPKTPKSAESNIPRSSNPNVTRSAISNILPSQDQNIARSTESNIQRQAERNVPHAGDQNIPRSANPNIPRSNETNIPRSAQPNIQRSTEPNIARSAQPNLPRTVEPNIPRSIDPNILRSHDPHITHSVNPNVPQSVGANPLEGINLDVYCKNFNQNLPGRTGMEPPFKDLAELLESLNLSKYNRVFEEQDVDLKIFLTLTDNDLKEVGIKLFGPRRKMTSAIARWHSQARIFTDTLEQVYADKVEAEMQEMAIQLHQATSEMEKFRAQVLQEKELRNVVEGCLMEDKRAWQHVHGISMETHKICFDIKLLYESIRLCQDELKNRLLFPHTQIGNSVEHRTIENLSANHIPDFHQQQLDKNRHGMRDRRSLDDRHGHYKDDQSACRSQMVDLTSLSNSEVVSMLEHYTKQMGKAVSIATFNMDQLVGQERSSYPAEPSARVLPDIK